MSTMEMAQELSLLKEAKKKIAVLVTGKDAEGEPVYFVEDEDGKELVMDGTRAGAVNWAKSHGYTLKKTNFFGFLKEANDAGYSKHVGKEPAIRTGTKVVKRGGKVTITSTGISSFGVEYDGKPVGEFYFTRSRDKDGVAHVNTHAKMADGTKVEWYYVFLKDIIRDMIDYAAKNWAEKQGLLGEPSVVKEANETKEEPTNLKLNDVVEKLKTEIKLPFFKVSHGTGIADSITIHFSQTPKEEWKGNIFHNGKSGIVHIFCSGQREKDNDTYRLDYGMNMSDLKIRRIKGPLSKVVDSVIKQLNA